MLLPDRHLHQCNFLGDWTTMKLQAKIGSQSVKFLLFYLSWLIGNLTIADNNIIVIMCGTHAEGRDSSFS